MVMIQLVMIQLLKLQLLKLQQIKIMTLNRNKKIYKIYKILIQKT